MKNQKERKERFQEKKRKIRIITKKKHVNNKTRSLIDNAKVTNT